MGKHVDSLADRYNDGQMDALMKRIQMDRQISKLVSEQTDRQKCTDEQTKVSD
jgi:hypothetical protein